MTTNHIKAILTSLRAMVVKMLPAYKLYVGSVVSDVQIGHGKMDTHGGTIGSGVLSNDDPSFTGFVVGKTYTAIVNGVSGEYAAKERRDDAVGFAAEDDTGYWELVSYGEQIWYSVAGAYSNATVSIVENKSIGNYNIKKLDKSLLPDNVYTDIDEALKTARSAMRPLNPVCTGYFSQNFDPYKNAGKNSHTEGYRSAGTGEASHAEGNTTVASGSASHAEGHSCQAVGIWSHAEGNGSDAVGYVSHAEGWATIATGSYSHVQGKMNKNDTDGKYAHIVGNGESSGARSNAHTLDWDGVPWYQGRPQFGGAAQDNGAQTVVGNGDKEIILASSTSGSTKKFKLTVDDTGTLSATEVTDA